MHYALTTEWVLDAPAEAIYATLTTPETWPRWWRYVEDVTLVRKGDAEGIGAVHRYTWSSRLPYRVSFDMETTALARPSCIEAVARGDLTGTGRWDLATEDCNARVRYTWRVTTGKRWMNALAPVLAPVFAWNHDQVMAEGGRGIARHLGVTLLRHGAERAHRASTAGGR